MTQDKSPTWEDMISINPPPRPFHVLDRARTYAVKPGEARWLAVEGTALADALARDVHPLPIPADRGGYFGERHFSYWASGLHDMHHLLACARRYEVPVHAYLDIGCSSGRVLRHFAANSSVERIVGCDINSRCIEWVLAHLPSRIEAFQNTSIPHLPLEDASLDLVSAFSVFSHIESFDLMWIMEIRRVLRPGGLAWITFHSERTWSEMQPSWPIHKNWIGYPPFRAARCAGSTDSDRMVFRRAADRSYSSIVFYDTAFLKNRWGRILDVFEVRQRSLPSFQDVIVLHKPR